MAERVDDTTLPHAVRLIRDREHLRRAGRDSSGVRRVRFVHRERDTDSRGTNRLRTRRSDLWGFGGDAKMLTGDPEDRNLSTIGCDQTITFFACVECPNVEVHRRSNVLNGQEWIQLRHRSDASTSPAISLSRRGYDNPSSLSTLSSRWTPTTS